MRGKELTMKPLANTDLQTYLRDLVDDYLPDENDRGKGRATLPKALRKPSGERNSRSTEEKDKRTERA
jgi:hypothetical protein